MPHASRSRTREATAADASPRRCPARRRRAPARVRQPRHLQPRGVRRACGPVARRSAGGGVRRRAHRRPGDRPQARPRGGAAAGRRRGPDRRRVRAVPGGVPPGHGAGTRARVLPAGAERRDVAAGLRRAAERRGLPAGPLPREAPAVAAQRAARPGHRERDGSGHSAAAAGDEPAAPVHAPRPPPGSLLHRRVRARDARPPARAPPVRVRARGRRDHPLRAAGAARLADLGPHRGARAAGGRARRVGRLHGAARGLGTGPRGDGPRARRRRLVLREPRRGRACAAGRLGLAAAAVGEPALRAAAGGRAAGRRVDGGTPAGGSGAAADRGPGRGTGVRGRP